MPSPVAELVEIASDGTTRLLRLVDDLLDMQKIEAGMLELVVGEHDLSALAQVAVRTVRPFAATRDVEVRLDVTEGPHLALCDPQRTLQVFENLLVNAVKFSSAGGSVQLRVASEAGAEVVEVIDAGRGVPDEFRGRLFQKFAQADGGDARTAEGTGLGLSICRALVSRMSGEIGFCARAGGGSVFFFRLPSAAP